jgi:hypothetical protein
VASVWKHPKDRHRCNRGGAPRLMLHLRSVHLGSARGTPRADPNPPGPAPTVFDPMGVHVLALTRGGMDHRSSRRASRSPCSRSDRAPAHALNVGRLAEENLDSPNQTGSRNSYSTHPSARRAQCRSSTNTGCRRIHTRATKKNWPAAVVTLAKSLAGP